MFFLTIKIPHNLIRRPDKKNMGILLAAAVFFIMSSLEFPESLGPVGAKLLTVLVAMLVIWITESVDYSTSSFFLLGIFTISLAGCPDPVSGEPMGTREALFMSLSGFSSEAWIMVTSALILASVVKESGLGQRAAYYILLMAGTPGKILLGTLFMSYVCSIFIPAQAANAALMCAISFSILEIYNIGRENNFAKALMLMVAFGTGIAGIGIQTSGAPTIQTANYLSEAGYQISWLSWSLYAMPFSVTAGVVLYFLIRLRLPVPDLPSETASIRNKLLDLGPLSVKELKLAAIMLATALLWATEQRFHGIDSSTVSILSVMALFLPFMKITSWDRLVKTINWGTLLLFGAAISLGQWLLKSGAASWVAKNTISLLNLEQLGLIPVVVISVAFFSLMSLAFSARAAAVAALVPAAIGFAQGFAQSHGVTVWGYTLILYFAIQYSVLLPVNTPMSMVAYSTNTFSAREMLGIGVPLVIILMVITLIFVKTYWHWMGLV